AIEQRAERRADAGGQQDRPRLPIGKVPVLYDERQNERDQEKIEEIEHVADRRRGEDLPLIDCQLLLLLQIFEHDACLPPRLIAPRLTRRQVWADIPGLRRRRAPLSVFWASIATGSSRCGLPWATDSTAEQQGGDQPIRRPI